MENSDRASTYRVKAFVEGLRAARAAQPRERNLLAEALHDVLAEQSRLLRAKNPESYAKVEAIKAQPGREVRLPAPLEIPEPAECLWCGDFILPDKSFCSMQCALDHKTWTASRNRRERDCPSCGKAFIVPREQPTKIFCSRICWRFSLK